ncbi:phage holin family protein [Sphingomonas sp. PB2P19]|uniref:phage holin family protein n=1 Tax=Sphingomonas rhamnosi TaxID=3096156 RepID=UPI002FC964DE
MPDPATYLPDHDEALPELVTRLVGETRALAGAEVAVYKAKFGITLAAYKTAAMFFAVAGTLAFAALIALLVGAIMALSTIMHPGWATAIVVGVVLVIAGILGFVGKSKLTPRGPTS